MSHIALCLPFRSAAADAGHGASQRFPAPTPAPTADGLDEAPFWSPSRIDLARRLWSKGLDEADILVALNKLSGPTSDNAQAIEALARRLRWPGPRQVRLAPILATRDGSPSIAERQAAELARTLDFVELPMEDAVAWGRANGVPRRLEDTDATLITRINQARGGWGLPRFRVMRHEPQVSLLPPRGKPAAGSGLRRG